MPQPVGPVARNMPWLRLIDLGAVVQDEAGAAVLRAPVLGQVHAAEHLDPAHHRGVQGAQQAAHRNQFVVDPEQDLGRLFAGAQVDVGGAPGHRVGDQPVYQPHHRLLPRKSLRLGFAGIDAGQGIQAEPACGLAILGQVVAACDGRADATRRPHQRHDPIGGDELDRGQRLAVGWIFHRHREQPLRRPQRNHPQLPGLGGRQQLGDFGIAYDSGKPNQGYVEATGVHVAALAGVVAAGQPVGKLHPGRHAAGPVCAALDIRQVAVQRGVIGDQDGLACVAYGGIGHQRFQCGSPTVWAGGRPRH